MSTPQVAEPTPKTAARTASIPTTAAVPVSWGWLAAAAVALFVAYAPLLWMFFHQQWLKPHYQFFPFVIGAFVWLIWQRYHQGSPHREETWAPRWLDRAILCASAALLLFAVAVHSPWCAIASLVLLVASIFLTLERSRKITNLWGIWVLLLLLVPMPFGLDLHLTQYMQHVSSRLSSFVLDFFGTEHLMDGNTLALASKDLFVDQACSGIISMLSVVACAVIYGVFMNRTPIHVLLLAAGGVMWAAIFNVARISTIAIVVDRWGVDLSTGTTHEILGLVLFLFTFLALLSTDQLLLVCLSPILPTWNRSAGHEMGMGSWLATAFDWLVSLGKSATVRPQPVAAANQAPAFSRNLRFLPQAVLLFFVPAAVLQAGLFAYVMQLKPLELAAVQRSLALTSHALPQTHLGLEKVDFAEQERGADSIFGMYSRVFTYRGPDNTLYTVSYDFPFPAEWHELTDCYVASGWERVSRQIMPGTDTKNGGEWEYVEADFSKPGGMKGTLYFSEFDQIGTKYKAQPGVIRDQQATWGDRNLYLSAQQLFQVQVWFAVPGEPTDAQRQTAHDLLLDARERLRNLVVGPQQADANSPKNSEEEQRDG